MKTEDIIKRLDELKLSSNKVELVGVDDANKLLNDGDKLFKKIDNSFETQTSKLANKLTKEMAQFNKFRRMVDGEYKKYLSEYKNLTGQDGAKSEAGRKYKRTLDAASSQIKFLDKRIINIKALF